MKKKLIKTDNYLLVVDDSEIKEGDYSFYPPFGIGKNIIIDEELCFYIEPKNNKGSFTQRTYQTLDKNKKITHSTQPLESLKIDSDVANIRYVSWGDIKYLPFQEVKELLGEMDKSEWEVEFDENGKLKLV